MKPCFMKATICALCCPSSSRSLRGIYDPTLKNGMEGESTLWKPPSRRTDCEETAPPTRPHKWRSIIVSRATIDLHLYPPHCTALRTRTKSAIPRHTKYHSFTTTIIPLHTGAVKALIAPARTPGVAQRRTLGSLPTEREKETHRAWQNEGRAKGLGFLVTVQLSHEEYVAHS